MLVEKVKAFMAKEFAWSEADMRSIPAPTFIVIVDSDTVRLAARAEPRAANGQYARPGGMGRNAR